MKKLGDVMNIHSLKWPGLSQMRIARKLGIHRQTVKKYLDQVQAWIEEGREYSAMWVCDCLVPLGFTRL